MTKLLRRFNLPKLSDATMVVSFEGWNDAGNAASLATTILRKQWQAKPCAEMDSEEFFNFADNRPETYVSAVGKRIINWPKTTIALANSEGSPGDVVFVYGTEPQLKWQSYSSALYRIAKRMNCRKAIFLGSYLTDVLHDSPSPVTVTGDITLPDSEKKFSPSTYEGPIGIVGVLQMEFESHHIPTSSIWAGVPSYGEGTSPKAALALVSALREITHGIVATTELERLSGEYEKRMTKMVENDELLSTYVTYVSQQNEFEELESSSGNIVKEIEDFLRKDND